MPDLKNHFLSLDEFEKIQEKEGGRSKSLKFSIEELEKNLQLFSTATQNRFETYTSLEFFRNESLKLTPLAEFMQMKNDMRLYAKTEDISRTFSQFKVTLEKQ